MKILVTGASGFIGSFIVEEALRQGFETWAVVRKSSSKVYLQDERINFIELNLSSKAKLIEQLRGHSFDYVVHAAGVTKCLNKQDFSRINTEGTKNLIDALLEEYLEQMASRVPYIILRPTGVYGPREKDYFIMAKSIKQHSDFAVGYKRQDITFVYVKDVVQAVFLALEKGQNGRKYFLSDGNVYQSETFSNLIHEELGRPWWIRIKAPIWVLRVVTFFGEYIGRATGKVTALNNDKYNILRQRNWRCDIQPAIAELGYKPEYDLQRGVKETIKWYKDNQWL